MKKKVKNNEAAFFHKGDLSPFYEPAIHIMKRGLVLEAYYMLMKEPHDGT